MSDNVVLGGLSLHGILPAEIVVVAGIAVLCHVFIKRFEIGCVVAWALSMAIVFWNVELRAAFFFFWLPFFIVEFVVPATTIVIVLGLPFHFVRTMGCSKPSDRSVDEVEQDEA